MILRCSHSRAIPQLHCCWCSQSKLLFFLAPFEVLWRPSPLTLIFSLNFCGTSHRSAQRVTAEPSLLGDHSDHDIAWHISPHLVRTFRYLLKSFLTPKLSCQSAVGWGIKADSYRQVTTFRLLWQPLSCFSTSSPSSCPTTDPPTTNRSENVYTENAQRDSLDCESFLLHLKPLRLLFVLLFVG